MTPGASPGNIAPHRVTSVPRLARAAIGSAHADLPLRTRGNHLMPMSTLVPRYTAEEVRRFPDDHLRYEVIRGERWRPGATNAEIVTQALAWQPVASLPALTIDLDELFHVVWMGRESGPR